MLSAKTISLSRMGSNAHGDGLVRSEVECAIDYMVYSAGFSAYIEEGDGKRGIACYTFGYDFATSD